MGKNLFPLIIAGLTVFLTAIAIVTSKYGWKIYLEIFSHYQLQYFVLVFLLFFVLCLIRRRVYILVGLFCCAVLATQILPWYIPPSFLFPKDSANLRILVANINTQNQSYSQVISLVRREQPDLAVFIEVDSTWSDKLSVLRDLLPYSFGQANPYNLGLLVYANQELLNPQIEFFGTPKNASVVAEITLEDQPITLLATHPLPPVKPSFFASRNQQLDLISQYLKTVKTPIVMAGDLNLTMWSPYYRRLMTKTGLKNARRGFGIIPTWPTKGTYAQIPDLASLLFSIPIDHCLLSPSIDVIEVRTGADTGSDHRPLIVDLQINT